MLIATAAFSVMFGTMITVFDGYARSTKQCLKLLFFPDISEDDDRKMYVLVTLVIAIGGYLIISVFSAHFKMLIDLTTTISFLIAPMIAISSLILVKRHVPEAAIPPKWMLGISYLGIVFLIVFLLWFLYLKF